jgi:hypothetical protein
MKKVYFALLVTIISFSCSVQKKGSEGFVHKENIGYPSCDYWQQKTRTELNVRFNESKNQIAGKQKLLYINNSPDTLTRSFFHLFYNAFQPGSGMDVRSRWIIDPDPRVKDRISLLKPEEEGWQKINGLTLNGKKVTYKVVGTILECDLPKSIFPNDTVTFEMDFESQVPLQIRRTGRDNREGIKYSMTQWFPKICAYDKNGWDTDPYIAREFYSGYGDYDVKIDIGSEFIIGGTGVLQNPQDIGYGYGKKTSAEKKSRNVWHFKAENVHDFAFAADKNYKHLIRKMENGPTLHFIYKENEKNKEAWSKLPELTEKAIRYIGSHYGPYPYPQYTVIQGGDGGMEYPMATLITGNRPLVSLVGVTVHELVHSWYYGILGTNERLYPWMDEGFTNFVSEEVMEHLFDRKTSPHQYIACYKGYTELATSGIEEPLTTHADHYNTNSAYGDASYNKGAVFLGQLMYVLGKENFYSGMWRYFQTWKYKHPTDEDFIRVMEKTSGVTLDWYRQYWVQTTKTIDYKIDTVYSMEKKTMLNLKRVGYMPMPIELELTLISGKKILYSIPLDLMRGHRNVKESEKISFLNPWQWTNVDYQLAIDIPLADIKMIKIDPDSMMADIQRENNIYTP